MGANDVIFSQDLDNRNYAKIILPHTVKEMTLVTAEAELLTVKDTDNRKSDKGRLFWALRGAGGGNFETRFFQITLSTRSFPMTILMSLL